MAGTSVSTCTTAIRQTLVRGRYGQLIVAQTDGVLTLQGNQYDPAVAIASSPDMKQDEADVLDALMRRSAVKRHWKGWWG